MSEAQFSYSGEVFVHKLIWQVVERQIRNAEKNQAGSFYDDMAALVFASHFVEGYVNYVGEILAPDLWADERKNFRDGLSGKIKKVFVLLDLPEPDRSGRPYKAVWDLKKVRDQIAHAKTVKRSGTVGGDMRAFMNTTLQYDFGGMLNHASVVETVFDIKELFTTIHEKFRRMPDVHALYSDPFDGITAYGSGVGQTAP